MAINPTSPRSPIIVTYEYHVETPVAPKLPPTTMYFPDKVDPSSSKEALASNSDDSPPLLAARTSNFHFQPDPLSDSQEERIRRVLFTLKDARTVVSRTPSPERFEGGESINGKE